MRPSLPSLALLALVALPWARAVADDAPPAPPPAPKDEAPAGRWTEAHPPSPDLKRVGSKVESPFLARWVKGPGSVWAQVPVTATWLAPGANGVWLRADGPPAPPVPAPGPASGEAAPLPRGIVPIGALPARIAAARAAGQEQTAAELQLVWEALSREEPGDATQVILCDRPGSVIVSPQVLVGDRRLPPGKYAVVAAELDARGIRATGDVTIWTDPTPGKSKPSLQPSDQRVYRDVDGRDVAVLVCGLSVLGSRQLAVEKAEQARAELLTRYKEEHPAVRQADAELAVARARLEAARKASEGARIEGIDVDGERFVYFAERVERRAPSAGGADAPTAPSAPSPALGVAIGELRAEIRALRDEIRALRAALEGTSAPK